MCTIKSHGEPPGTIYYDRSFGEGWGWGDMHRRDYSQGGLYTGWDIGTAVSQHLWLGKLVQNITNIIISRHNEKCCELQVSITG